MNLESTSRISHASALLLLALLVQSGCANSTTWRPFDNSWEAAHDAQPTENGIVGAWGGPWRNDSSGKEGFVLLVIEESPSGGLQAWAKIHLKHPIWEKAYQTSDGAPWVIDAFVHADPRPDGTIEVGGRAEQPWLFGRKEIVCHGVANGSEMVATFQRADECGRMRLRKIKPSPEQNFIQIPGVATVAYSPKELREQLLAIRRMPLDPPTAEPVSDGPVLPAAFERNVQ